LYFTEQPLYHVPSETQSNELTMQPSEIVISNQDVTPIEEDFHNEKIRQAYLRERENLQNIEIELNRSKVIVVDQTGKILKLGLDIEH